MSGDCNRVGFLPVLHRVNNKSDQHDKHAKKEQFDRAGLPAPGGQGDNTARTTRLSRCWKVRLRFPVPVPPMMFPVF